MLKLHWRRQARSWMIVSVALLLVAGIIGYLVVRAVGIDQAVAQHPVSSSKKKQISEEDLTSLVNPFIGTAPGGTTNFGLVGNSGNTLPGAAFPLGMVQWSPDTPSNLPGGYYYPDTLIKGFSLTHFSGRGCVAYQDFPFIPYVGELKQSPASSPALFYAAFSHAQEMASPGYYKVRLSQPDVTVELTTAAHSGIGQFTFPPSSEASILINGSGSARGNTATSLNINPAQQFVSGSTTSVIGCGTASYTIYFAALFDTSFRSYGTWQEDVVKNLSSSSQGTEAGTFLVFDTSHAQTIRVKVGISFVSVANALENVRAEIPDWGFNKVRSSAQAAWNARLNSIQIQGGTFDERVIFYTALYHCFFHPNVFDDVNGQYIGFDHVVHMVPQGHHQYENIPGWDQYRSLIALRTILYPDEASDIVQSLLRDAQQSDGHLPRWEQVNADSRGMIGDSADAIIAMTYALGGRDFNLNAALTFMDAGQPLMREGFQDYTHLGYVADMRAAGSASMTLEYSVDDFALAQFAQSVGDNERALKFRERSRNWQNVFNPKTGYIQPRYADGSWVMGVGPTTNQGFTEGNAAQYTWLVPFNLAGLFAALGGSESVISRLDTFFTKLNDGSLSGYAYMGNEPSFEVPWEYDFAGAPSQTQRVVRDIQLNLFKNAPDGLPGNDDAGSLSSWYVFSTLGLYPLIPGVGGFVFGSPFFQSITVQIGNNVFQINAPAVSGDTPYVQGLRINHASTSSLWLTWDILKTGPTLDFTLQRSSTLWGSDSKDSPPSFP